MITIGITINAGWPSLAREETSQEVNPITELTVTMRIFLPVVPLLTLVVADYSSKKGYTCTEFLLDIPVENATTIVLPLPPIENRYQAISYGQAISTPPGDTPPPPPETSSLTKIFQISGDLCTPNNPGPKSSTIQLLTNGIGYNRTYWDFYLPG